MTISFVRLHESNDWEGERWDFWLQLTGNVEGIVKLSDLLRQEEAKMGFDLPYTLHLEDVEPEWAVDKLVEYAMPGYADSVNKITGKFTCPDWLGEEAEKLYKGGIYAFFKDE